LGQAYLGKTLSSNGDPQRGIRLLEEGLRSLNAAGSMLMSTQLRTNLAEGFVALGELKKARVHLVEGQTYSEKYGELFYAAEVVRVEAQLLRAEGASTQMVERRLNEAIRVARGQGARLLELRAATDLAGLWRDEGRWAEAHALLAPIYGWFTEGFAMPDLQEAKALLDDLR
jgi:predicted ATPase